MGGRSTGLMCGHDNEEGGAMKGRMLAAACMAAWLGTAGAAGANDAYTTLGAGGLVLSKTADVAMVREDLDIAVDRIKVRYLFRNRSGKDITARVAFPMPRVYGPAYANSPFHIPDEAENFVRFSVVVDGKPLRADLFEKAVSRSNRDVTPEVRRLGIPPNFLLKDWERTPGADFKAAAAKGLVDDEGTPENPQRTATWSYEATYHWEQVFPAGKDVVVEHAYVPVVGSGTGDSLEFCVDDGTEAAIRKLWPKGREPGEHFASDHVEYVLGTARTWAGPIDEFHLTVRKADPRGVVSLCLDGIRKTSPTTFEFTARDYVPPNTLKVLFVRPPTADEEKAPPRAP